MKKKKNYGCREGISGSIKPGYVVHILGRSSPAPVIIIIVVVIFIFIFSSFQVIFIFLCQSLHNRKFQTRGA